MERITAGMARCLATYSRIKYMKSLQRCAFSTSQLVCGRWEPDDLKLTPDIPEYDSINIRLQGYDYVVVEGFMKHVHNVAMHMNLNVDCWPVPAQRWKINNLRPHSEITKYTYVLDRYERVVQLQDLPSPTLPIFLEIIRNNAPQGIHISLKQPEEGDDEFLYVPNFEIDELTEKRQALEEHKPS